MTSAHVASTLGSCYFSREALVREKVKRKGEMNYQAFTSERSSKVLVGAFRAKIAEVQALSFCRSLSPTRK